MSITSLKKTTSVCLEITSIEPNAICHEIKRAVECCRWMAFDSNDYGWPSAYYFSGKSRYYRYNNSKCRESPKICPQHRKLDSITYHFNGLVPCRIFLTCFLIVGSPTPQCFLHTPVPSFHENVPEVLFSTNPAEVKIWDSLNAGLKHCAEYSYCNSQTAPEVEGARDFLLFDKR